MTDTTQTARAVDDLLAWLHDPNNERHGWQVRAIEPYRDDQGWAVMLYPWVGEYYEQTNSDTLLAALEAAVRLVAAGCSVSGDETP